jgi:hypothetical protein
MNNLSFKRDLQRCVHCILLISCFLCSTSVLAQRSALAEKQCYKLGSHADARACLEEHSKESALAVTKTEQSLISTLSQRNEEQQYKDSSISKLKSSSIKFQNYRKAQC